MATHNPATVMQRWQGASTNVVQAIRNASSRTGVSFDYLMNKAKQESSFNPDAKATTSSATGLFQFIESTWLHAVKNYGQQFGIGHLANKISDSGHVSDPVAKQEILKLREDPEMASNMVAAMTRDNASVLEESLGGKVGQNELYMAHFLGLGGASQFLKARQNNPMQAAADIFPAAAKANKNVFYDASGRKKTLDEVYNFFAGKFNPNGSTTTTPTLVASSGRSFGTGATQDRVTFRAAGSGFSVTETGQIHTDLTAATQWGERQMLEAMLSGVTNFGIGDKTGSRPDGHLLSPYTSYVLAKLYAPSENATDNGRGDRNNNVSKPVPLNPVI